MTFITRSTARLMFSVGPPNLDPQAMPCELMDHGCGLRSEDDGQSNHPFPLPKERERKETPLLLRDRMEMTQGSHPDLLECKGFIT